MARATLSVQELVLGGGTVTASGGTIVQADGALIRAGGNTRKLFLHVTAGTIAGTLTIPAGDNPPAFREDLGDVTVVLTANQTQFVAVESARHAKSNGDIWINSAGELVVVKAYRLPDDL
jgi:hypothetical protein